MNSRGSPDPRDNRHPGLNPGGVLLSDPGCAARFDGATPPGWRALCITSRGFHSFLASPPAIHGEPLRGSSGGLPGFSEALRGSLQSSVAFGGLRSASAEAKSSTRRNAFGSAWRFRLKAGLQLLPAFAALSVNAEEQVHYERDIAPILRSYCAGCHNDKDLEGKLSMETFAQLRKGGEDHAEPVKPGDPDNSFLIRSIEGREKPKMPPKDEPPLPEEEKAMLRKWVASGAPGPGNDVSILKSLTVPKVAAAAQEKPVTAAAYSVDGKWLALARTGVIEIREAATDAVRHTIAGPPGKVNAVHFTADGSQIVIASGITGLHGVAQLRKVDGGEVVREFGGHADVLYDAEISPDGKTLATAGYDRAIRLWNVADGALHRTIDVHKGAIFDLAWHPDGKVLASASADETVKLWRVSDGVRLDTLNQPQGELAAVLFTNDGEHIIAAGKDKRIHLWRFVSKESPALNPPVHSRFAHEAAVTGLALSADGKHLLSAADDRSLKLWSVPDLTLEHAYETQPDVAAVLAGMPGAAKFFAARMDGTRNVVAVENGSSGKAEKHGPNVSAVSHTSPQSPASHLKEAEPNNDSAVAMPVSLPAEIKGAVSASGDADVFRFHAVAGEALTLEVNAARSKSKLDSRLEILTKSGEPVEQVVLQATRDSWFTFRGKDSDTSDDFRLHNWAEMELNEYLYANGEVVKLWLYPRGPDSGFKVYPGGGKRHTFFGTPALVHALGAPSYVVNPLPPGSQPAPNGLPVFRLNYENDDDPYRRFGADSLLLFTAPAEGDYLARLTDVRGFGGADHGYTLTIRAQQPDFKVSIGGGPKISPGSGREISLTAERMEGFDGPIRIDIANLPAGFTVSAPVEIEAGQTSAIAVLHAVADAANPDEAADKAVKVTATARIGEKDVTKDLGTLGDIQLAPAPKVTVEILPGTDRSFVTETAGMPLEFSISPGQTISAKVRAVRHDFPGRIELGGDDSGRNLPHGLYVDNIGLNGLLIVEGQTERDFFITASKIACPCTRLFHLRATADGGQASRPVLIRVLPAGK
jgi:WD40 repeat protein